MPIATGAGAGAGAAAGAIVATASAAAASADAAPAIGAAAAGGGAGAGSVLSCILLSESAGPWKTTGADMSAGAIARAGEKAGARLEEALGTSSMTTGPRAVSEGGADNCAGTGASA